MDIFIVIGLLKLKKFKLLISEFTDWEVNPFIIKLLILKTNFNPI